MLPRAYNFFPKASIQVGQTPTFSAPTHKYQQASAGLGFQAENKPLVPPRPTLPGLEPTAVSQSWEQGLSQLLLPSRVRGDSCPLFSEGPYLPFSGT